jgi:hypothetical protein
MIIGFLSLELFMPFSHSLKEKRKVLNSFRDRVRRRYNVALAELDYQDKWQRARIGIVTLNSGKKVVEDVLNRILAEAQEMVDGEILAHDIQFF